MMILHGKLSTVPPKHPRRETDNVALQRILGKKIDIIFVSTAVLDLVEIVLEQRGVSVFKFNAKIRKAGSRQPPSPLLTTALSASSFQGSKIYNKTLIKAGG